MRGPEDTRPLFHDATDHAGAGAGATVRSRGRNRASEAASLVDGRGDREDCGEGLCAAIP